MRTRLSTGWSVLMAAALVAGGAHAQARRAAPAAAAGGSYSLIGGDTVGNNNNVVSGEAGWPGVSFGYTHGFSPTTDAGVRLDLNYGIETTTNTQFGLGLRAPLRLMALRRDRLSMLVHIDPGIKLYTTSSATFGFQWPVGLTLGYAATPEVNVAFGVELPMTLTVTPSPVVFYIGPLFGPALEYKVDRQLTIGLNTRFGPMIANTGSTTVGPPGFTTTVGGGSSTSFGFITQFLLAYRI